jgi:prolipoprotein diacylglyceryl transferase
VNTIVLAPLSIPSPPEDLQGINIPIGPWLHGILNFVSVDQVLSVRTYAIVILIGIVAAVIMTSRRLTARGAEPGIVLDIVLWTVPLGIVGARAYHVLTHPSDYFGEGKELIKVLFVWEGGLAIFGGLIAGAIGMWIGCKLTGVRFWAFADALAPGLLLAQAFGRLGNYFNHELFGQPTDLPWGLEIEASNSAWPVGLPAGTLFHPTFLYEILWNLLGVAVLLIVEKKWKTTTKTIAGLALSVPTVDGIKLYWGKMIGLYLIWYGAGRIVWETIRVDPSEVFFGIRTNVWAAIFAVIIGLAIIVIQSRRHYGTPPSVYAPGREWDGGVDSEETYSDNDVASNVAEAAPKSS